MPIPPAVHGRPGDHVSQTPRFATSPENATATTARPQPAGSHGQAATKAGAESSDGSGSQTAKRPQ